MARCLDGHAGLAAVRRTNRARDSCPCGGVAYAGVAMRRPSILTIATIFVAAIVATVIAIQTVLRVPSIPYNARELSLDDASTRSAIAPGINGAPIASIGAKYGARSHRARSL